MLYTRSSAFLVFLPQSLVTGVLLSPRKHSKSFAKAVRTPRANGQAERANETLLNALRCSTSDPKDWDVELVKIQWAINSQPNATTKYTPNELVFNYNVNDIANNHLIAALTTDVTAHEPIKDSGQKQITALENINAERARWKKRFDDKHADPTIYEEGDLVVLKTEPPPTGESRKLEAKYRGPYMVNKVLGRDRLVITDIPGSQITTIPFNSVYDSDQMKPWCSSYPELLPENDEDNSDSEGETEEDIAVETPDSQDVAELSQ